MFPETMVCAVLVNWGLKNIIKIEKNYRALIQKQTNHILSYIGKEMQKIILINQT